MRASNSKIRLAKLADVPSLARMHVQSWHETYTGIMPSEVLSAMTIPRRTQGWEDVLQNQAKHNDSVIYLYEADDVLCGFGACSGQRDSDLKSRGFGGELGAIYVLQQYQASGIGAVLLRHVANDLIMRGESGMSLWVLKENRRARGFYEKYGGEIVGQREDTRGTVVLTELAYGWRDLAALTIGIQGANERMFP